MKEKILCVDIGGTAIKYAVISGEGEFLCKSSCATQAEAGGAGLAAKVEELGKQLSRDHELAGVSISTAGMVDCERGQIIYSGPNLPEYEGLNWKQEVKKRLGLPCEVENDVNCAGYAESRSGAAAGAKSALCLTIGTGIGGCAVLDGKLLHGASYGACEIGYMEMDGSTFEELGAASALAAKVAAWKGETEENWDGLRIFSAARQGDAVCLRAIDEMCEILGRGIATLLLVLNPEVVVLGGGIMEQKAVLEKRLTEALQRHAKPVLLSHTRLAFAQHGNDAGVLGAYYLFCDRRANRKAACFNRSLY